MPNTSTKKHLSATVYYFFVALIFSWPCFFATGKLLPLWQNGDTFTPLSLAVVHTLILGFMLTVAFGVLYQIVPIAFQAPPIHRHVLFWHLPIHALSVIAMAYGFLAYHLTLVGIGGSVLVVNTVAYFVFVARSYMKARNKTVVHRAIAIALLSLWVVLFIGLWQAFWPDRVGQSLFLTHVVVGGFAFWGGLVFAFSYKLVPMFSISHGYKASLPRTMGLYFAGVVCLVVAMWLTGEAGAVLRYVATIFILLALGSFALDVVAILRARKRRRLVMPMYDAMTATGCIVLGQVFMLISIVSHALVWLYPATYLFWFGGLMPLILGYMQKIVPFLWFEYRFSKRPERKTAPLIDDMVPKRTAQIGFWLYYVGVIAGLFSLVAGALTVSTGGAQGVGWISVGWISAACLTAGSVFLFVALRYVTTIGGRRPSED